ncbi:recombinase RecT [bacterium]|nr:recombinase RecT [bacterium]
MAKDDKVTTIDIKETAVARSGRIIEGVSSRIAELENKEGVAFPKGSNPQTTLRQAHLILSGQVKKTKKGNDWVSTPVLSYCTEPSIYKALLDMVMLGLNPSKSQCYFIPYGKELQLSVSYMGKMAIARSVRPDIQDISSQVVWEGDEFEYEIKRGKIQVVKHSRKAVASPDSKKFEGAYCEVYDKNDKLLFSDFMTNKEILESWKASKAKPFASQDQYYKGNSDDYGLRVDSIHHLHMGEMVKRTIIARVLKLAINSSDDKNLVAQSIKKVEADQAATEFEVSMEDKENAIEVDVIPDEPTKEIETAEGEKEASPRKSNRRGQHGFPEF